MLALSAFTRFGLLHRRLERSSFLSPEACSSAADDGVGGWVCFSVWSLLSLLYFLFFQGLGCNRGLYCAGYLIYCPPLQKKLLFVGDASWRHHTEGPQHHRAHEASQRSRGCKPKNQRR
jgi:hypothetical protein